MRMQRLIPMLLVKSMPASIGCYQKHGFSVEQRNDNWGWAMLCFDEFHIDGGSIDQSSFEHASRPIVAIFMQMSFLSLFQRNKSNYFIDLWLYRLIEN